MGGSPFWPGPYYVVQVELVAIFLLYVGISDMSY